MEKIADKIYFIVGRNSGKFPFCNVLLVDRVLIDAGAGIDIVKELVNRADTLLLSHIHPDHASGAWIFNEAGKVVLAPAGFATDLDSIAKRFMTEKYAELWKRVIAEPIGMKSFRAEGYEEGLMVFDNVEIEAVAAFGHTKDHHVFVIDGKIMYGADIDLTSFGPFYGNPEGDLNEFRRSIEKVLEYDVDVFVSSHTNPIFGREKIEDRIVRYLEILDERDKIILDLLAEPKSVEELVEASPIYRKKPYAKEILDFFEKNMILQHLNKLEREGKVVRLGNSFVRRR